MAYFEHRFGKTFYLSKGTKKTPLICLHGGPGSGCKSLKPFFELSKDRQVVIYDQIGCGKSSATPHNLWSMKVFVQELDLLATHLGFEKFFIFGVSCGATLALEYALAHPKRVEGIVFQSPFFSTRDWQKDAIQLIKSNMPSSIKKTLLDTIKGVYVEDTEYEKAKRAYYLKHVIRKASLYDSRMKSRKNSQGGRVYEYMWGRSEHHVSGTLVTYERENKLKSIKAPSLVVCGEHDEATPSTGKKYAKKLKAKFEEVRGASQAISAEKPKQLIKLVKSFLSDVETLKAT